MKRILISSLLLLITSMCTAQVLVNLRIDMNGKYDDMDEVDLKARDYEWSVTWDDVTKPAIYQDVLKCLNKHEKDKEFGNFPKTRYELVITGIEMDEDGETTATVKLTDTRSGEVLFSHEYQKDGDETKDFTRISSKSLKAIASAAAKKLNKISL